MSSPYPTRVEVYQGPRATWRWRARAANGEIIATGEGYVSKWNAKRGARRAFPGAPISEA